MEVNTYGWKTTKGPIGYRWAVRETSGNWPHLRTEIVKQGTEPTRSKAVRQARNWTRYFRRRANMIPA